MADWMTLSCAFFNEVLPSFIFGDFAAAARAERRRAEKHCLYLVYCNIAALRLLLLLRATYVFAVRHRWRLCSNGSS